MAAKSRKFSYFFAMLSDLTFLFLLSFFIHGNAQISLPFRWCSNSTFIPNSTYQSNLRLLFSNLSSTAPGVNGFYNASVAGRTLNDTVYGLFQCRGDQTDDVCRTCVAEATRDVGRRFCPLSKEAVVWYNDCLFRYSDRLFFSTMSTEPSLQLLKTVDFQIGVIVFDGNVIMSVLRTTAVKAAALSSKRVMFSSEKLSSGNQSLFALAQCSGDLSNSNCEACLSEAVKRVSICCAGKQGATVLFPSCYVRYEIFPFSGDGTQNPVSSPAIPTPPSATPWASEKSISSRVLVVNVVVPITVSMLLVVGWCFLCKKAKEKHDTDVKKDANVDNEIMTVESLQYDFNTIDDATNKFSENNKLGRGGFGEVYKGVLANGIEIAVKRLSKGSLQGSEEFKNEVLLVAKLQHRNLATLLGFCMEGEEKILIYEYIPNKSLDYFLYDRERRKELDWSRRYKIISGIVRGILYLHEDSRLRVIHRDLKASNVLLDRDFNPKISDFGLARIIQIDQTQGTTCRIVGTYGYMSPEYAMHGKFSMKSDVYSFGVLVLEIISGNKNRTFYLSKLGEDILSYAWKLWKKGTPLELLDPDLKDSYARAEVLRLIHIGLLCVQDDPNDRPSMTSIILMLTKYSLTLPLPKHPAFFIHSKHDNIFSGADFDQSAHKLMLSSTTNEITESQLYPR